MFAVFIASWVVSVVDGEVCLVRSFEDIFFACGKCFIRVRKGALCRNSQIFCVAPLLSAESIVPPSCLRVKLEKAGIPRRIPAGAWVYPRRSVGFLRLIRLRFTHASHLIRKTACPPLLFKRVQVLPVCHIFSHAFTSIFHSPKSSPWSLVRPLYSRNTGLPSGFLFLLRIRATLGIQLQTLKNCTDSAAAKKLQFERGSGSYTSPWEGNPVAHVALSKF